MRDEVAVEVHCGHCFHYGCLNTLINGILEYSNICPNCRQTICPPRAKRVLADFTPSLPSTPSAEVPEAQGDSAVRASDLCDKEM